MHVMILVFDWNWSALEIFIYIYIYICWFVYFEYLWLFDFSYINYLWVSGIDRYFCMQFDLHDTFLHLIVFWFCTFIAWASIGVSHLASMLSRYHFQPSYCLYAYLHTYKYFSMVLTSQYRLHLLSPYICIIYV